MKRLIVYILIANFVSIVVTFISLFALAFLSYPITNDTITIVALLSIGSCYFYAQYLAKEHNKRIEKIQWFGNNL